jgi:tRNA pseudouridine55 synthase
MTTSGILILGKPPGVTSHDAVDRARFVTRIRRIGHAGTLDPFAEGVLILGVGQGTKVLGWLSDLPKEYVATLRLGESTPTLDTESAVERREPVPEVDAAEIATVLGSLVGEHRQTPPAFSAVKVEGIRAYQRARSGEAVTLAPRIVSLLQLEVLEWDAPNLVFRALVSRGTYLRTLGADIARLLGTCGYLTRLRRTAIGRFALAEAIPMNNLNGAVSSRGVEPLLIPLEEALGHLPAVTVDEPGADLVRHGNFPLRGFASAVTPVPGSTYRVLDPAGKLAALAIPDQGRSPVPWRLERVFTAP